MKDTYNFKLLELQRIKNGIASSKEALDEVEEKINNFEDNENKNILILEKEELQKNLKNLETEKEKINDDLIDNEEMTEIIKIKYALLLSNYAIYHDNPVSKPNKKEIKPSIKTSIKQLFQHN